MRLPKHVPKIERRAWAAGALAAGRIAGPHAGANWISPINFQQPIHAAAEPGPACRHHRRTTQPWASSHGLSSIACAAQQHLSRPRGVPNPPARRPMPPSCHQRPGGGRAPLPALAHLAALLLLLLAAPRPAAADAGLTRELYHLGTITSLPLPAGAPYATDVVPTVSCAAAANCYPAPMQAALYGYINLGSGTYTFYLGSRDGASLSIAGVDLVTNPGERAGRNGACGVFMA